MKTTISLLFIIITLLLTTHANAHGYDPCRYWSDDYESYAHCVEENPQKYDKERWLRGVCSEWSINFETYEDCLDYYRR